MTTAYYRHKYCPDTSYLRPKYIYIPKTPVRKFFESLIPPQIIDSEKWTDLHLAVGYKNIKLVQSVCNKHNINIKDAKGRTALELAILGDNLEIVQFLVQNGGVVAPNNMYGWSAIHLAIKVGNLDIVKYLYENTKFNEHDKYGLTLQNWAEKVGNEQI
ncbi:ankyrin repeat family protein [Rickettsia bellii str. RML Mogi]|nr:ankyrin repeat family protein [Rickettsia bellii str. RML An4]KJV92455.1 ankyrin repeat family protein [Rickettsia bellii str. RML Mogi]